MLGDLYDRVGDPIAARRWFGTVAELDPEFADVEQRSAYPRSLKPPGAIGPGTIAAMPSMQFRAGVVAVVTNAGGQVMAFERSDVPGAWQLPQGGIDVGEATGDAAWRELFEETGLGPDEVELVGEYPSGRSTNGLPNCATVGDGTRGNDSGQAQRWFVFRVRDDDVEPTPDGVEFGRRGGGWSRDWLSTRWSSSGARPTSGCSAVSTGRGGMLMADDLFSAAGEELRRSRAPRSPPVASAHDRRRGRPGPPRRTRPAAAGARRKSTGCRRCCSGARPAPARPRWLWRSPAAPPGAFEQMSAVNAGVKDVRATIESARHRLGERGQGTILFLDEIHRFSKSQQDALLPAVEDGTLTLIGATTENPFFEVNAPLRSRSTLFRLEPLDRSAIRQLVDRGLQAEAVVADDDAIDLLIDRAGGDGRQVLTALEVACALSGYGHVELHHVEEALGTSALRYGRDDHYDVVSAFIKSMRGSDPDAAVYWLARMLEAGEDARFIVRRMVIFASEDVGLADSGALDGRGRRGARPGTRRVSRRRSSTCRRRRSTSRPPRRSNRAALAIWNATRGRA